MTATVSERTSNADVEKIRWLLIAMAHSIVDTTEAVCVDATEDGEAALLTLKVAPDELGKIIGVEGKVTKSLRALVGAMGCAANIGVLVELVDEAAYVATHPECLPDRSRGVRLLASGDKVSRATFLRRDRY